MSGLQSVARAHAPPCAANTASAQHVYPLTFDANPAVYARLWLFNLSLVVLSLGVYYPWARARFLRFVYQHTSMGGHRFDFHGDPKRMWRPTMIFGAFLLLYAIASYLDPLAGFIAAVCFALLWPAVWRASTAFRLAQTSYRGLRIRFSVSGSAAYEHVGAPLVLFIFPMAWLGVDKSIFDMHSIWTMASVVALMAWLALYPAVLWRVKRALHSNSSWGGQTFVMRLHARTLFAAFTPVYLAALVIAVLGVGTGVLSGFEFLETAGKGLVVDIIYKRPKTMLWLWLSGAGLLAFIVLRALAIKAAHNLLWSRTLGQGVRLRARLMQGPVLGLQARNTALLLLTLGLYWPWAKMAMLKLRIEAVSLVCNRPLEALLQTAAQFPQAAGAEWSADMASAEIGL